jgi:hypothetical protein
MNIFFILKIITSDNISQANACSKSAGTIACFDNIYLLIYIYIYIIFIGSSTCTPSNYLKKSMAVCRWSTFGRKGEPSD